MNPLLGRRGLLRAGALGAAGGLTLTPAAAAAADGTRGAARGSAPHHEAGGPPTRDPFVLQRADPFITRPVRGQYYMTASVPTYDRIVVRGAPDLGELPWAPERTIWRRPPSGRLAGYIWAPELHRIDGRWYVYFAGGDGDDPFRIRMYVMESRRADPRETGWTPPHQVVSPIQSFALDATTFEHRGRRYYVWAEKDPATGFSSNLYIAELDSPFALATDPVRIARPTQPWEVQGFEVNEGPAVIVRNGRVFMTFSASATDDRYCMGLLTADARADLLDAASWTKSSAPVLTSSPATSRYGPGHNSFTVDRDGHDVLVYHARDYRDIDGDPLFDPNRHTRLQRLWWNLDGTPALGVPIGDGGPVRQLRPTGRPGSLVTHAGPGEAVVATPDGARPARSWFRVVPGLGGGPDARGLESVDLPNHYLTFRGDEVVLAPFADSDAFAVTTRLVREAGLADRRATSWRRSDGTGQYLTVRAGRLVSSRPWSRREREAATFDLL